MHLLSPFSFNLPFYEHKKRPSYMHNLPLCKFTPGCKIAPRSKFATPYVHMPINCIHMLLDLLFKHITNVSVLLKGEIRCVKNVSIVSQFKIPSCEKRFYLLYLFIQYLKRIKHQSFVSTAPTYGYSLGIAAVRCWTITF